MKEKENKLSEKMKKQVHYLFHQRSVFIMVLSLFFLFAIPVYLIGLGVYQWGYQTIEKEITSGLRNYLTDAENTGESEIERIRKLQYSCMNDEDLFYTVNAENIMLPYEKVQSLLRMQHRLEVLEESSSFIQDVKACLIRTGRMVSSGRGVEPLNDEWKQILYKESDEALSRITYLDGKMHLCSSYPVLSPDITAVPLYTITVSLDNDAIIEKLLSFTNFENSITALFQEEQHFLLTKGNNASFLADEITGQPELLEKLRKGENCRISFEKDMYLVLGTYSEYLNMTFFSCVAEKDIFAGLWHYRNLGIVLFCVMFALAGAFSIGSYWLIRKPMKLLVHSLKKVEAGDLTIRIQHKMNDEYAYLYDSFNNMVQALENLIDMNYKQKLLTQQAQMRQLQTQINPHFLYNSFFTLYRMAKDEDYESVTEFLVYLSEYYHYITRDARKDVALSEEVNHAENYAHIQQIRFGRRIKVNLETLPDNLRNLQVPRLILQPVLENAFSHGLREIQENGLLEMKYEANDENLMIRIENNGTELTASEFEQLCVRLENRDENQEITGLVNIHQRLRIRFGDNSGIRLEMRPGGGLIVKLTMPLKEEQ